MKRITLLLILALLLAGCGETVRRGYPDYPQSYYRAPYYWQPYHEYYGYPYGFPYYGDLPHGYFPETLRERYDRKQIPTWEEEARPGIYWEKPPLDRYAPGGRDLP